MTDRPTPETDALVPSQGRIRTIREYIEELEAHARRLERQRDGLLEACKECDEAFGKFCPDPDSRYGMAWSTVKTAIAAVKGGTP